MVSVSELDSILFCFFIIIFIGGIQLTRENWITINIYSRWYYIKAKLWIKKKLGIKKSVVDD